MHRFPLTNDERLTAYSVVLKDVLNRLDQVGDHQRQASSFLVQETVHDCPSLCFACAEVLVDKDFDEFAELIKKGVNTETDAKGLEISTRMTHHLELINEDGLLNSFRQRRADRRAHRYPDPGTDCHQRSHSATCQGCHQRFRGGNEARKKSISTNGRERKQQQPRIAVFVCLPGFRARSK